MWEDSVEIQGGGALTLTERRGIMRSLEDLLNENNLSDSSDIDALLELAEITRQAISGECYTSSLKCMRPLPVLLQCCLELLRFCAECWQRYTIAFLPASPVREMLSLTDTELLAIMRM